MIVEGKKKRYGLNAQKRLRPEAYMREVADRVSHTGEKMDDARKIALVGTADTAQHAPFGDPTWEIWGVGGRREWVTHADRWYEVHRLAGNSETWVEAWREQALSWEGKTDIYMHYPEPGFGDNVFPYPAEHIMQRFGTHFLTSSFAWMLAHAIDELADTPGAIGIWGIDMEYGSEYGHQRAGFHHFVDLARYAGISIIRLASSGLSYQSIPYPMWQDDPLLNKLDKRQTYARDALIALDKNIPRTETMIASNKAVAEALEHFLPASKDQISSLEKETTEMEATLDNMRQDLIHWDSIEGEQQWLRNYLTA